MVFFSKDSNTNIHTLLMNLNEKVDQLDEEQKQQVPILLEGIQEILDVQGEDSKKLLRKLHLKNSAELHAIREQVQDLQMRIGVIFARTAVR